MASQKLIILYQEADQKKTNWLEQLTLYLAPMRRRGVVDIWDDRSIPAGEIRDDEINAAVERATAVILLVGPAFIAADELMTNIVPRLLNRTLKSRPKLYPLIVRHCNYESSELGGYQWVNHPSTPLEAIAEEDQNRILNELCVTVERDLRAEAVNISPALDRADTSAAIRDLAKHLASTRLAFRAQAKRRNDLVAALRQRLGDLEALEYEKLFIRYHRQLTQPELIEFNQIRAITDGLLYPANRTLFDMIEHDRGLIDEIPTLGDLRQHLVFWLNKYERIFTRTPEMCVLYVGVEDAVPFPAGLDAEVERWLARER